MLKDANWRSLHITIKSEKNNMQTKKNARLDWLKWNEQTHPIYPMFPTIFVFVIGVWVVYQKLTLHNFDPMSFVDVDGTFVYNLAVSFPSLDAPLDVPAYRAQRILLSVLAAPFGPFIPQALIIINLLMLALGTYILAKIGKQYRVSTLLGCVFGIWIGSLFVIQLNLTEVVAHALVLASILAWERNKYGTSALLSGLAILTKETTVLYAVALLFGQHKWSYSRVFNFMLLALGPGIIWQIVLLLQFGRLGITAGTQSAGQNMFPLLGLINAKTEAPWAWGVQILWVLVPAIAAVIIGVCLLWKRTSWAVAWALVLNGLFIIVLPATSTNYLAHSMRIGLAVVVALAWVVARSGRPRLVLLFTVLMVLPLMLFKPGFYF